MSRSARAKYVITTAVVKNPSQNTQLLRNAHVLLSVIRRVLVPKSNAPTGDAPKMAILTDRRITLIRASGSLHCGRVGGAAQLAGWDGRRELTARETATRIERNDLVYYC